MSFDSSDSDLAIDLDEILHGIADPSHEKAKGERKDRDTFPSTNEGNEESSSMHVTQGPRRAVAQPGALRVAGFHSRSGSPVSFSPSTSENGIDEEESPAVIVATLVEHSVEGNDQDAKVSSAGVALPWARAMPALSRRGFCWIVAVIAIVSAAVTGILVFLLLDVGTGTTRIDQTDVDGTNGTRGSAPTPSPTTFSFRAIQNTQALYIAVNEYLTSENASTSYVTSQYGYPIGTWNVSLVNDFSSVFDRD